MLRLSLLLEKNILNKKVALYAILHAQKKLAQNDTY